MVDRDRNLAEMLHLDGEALSRLTRLYEGYARIYDHSRLDNIRETTDSRRSIGYTDNPLWDPPTPDEPIRLESRQSDVAVLAASSFVVAAVSRSLERTGNAKDLFRQAAQSYRDLRNPYYVVLAVCGSDTALVHEYLETQLTPTDATVTPDIVLYNLIAAMYIATLDPFPTDSASFVLIETREQAQQYRLAPVGRLGLPLSLYLDLASAVPIPSRNREASERRLRERRLRDSFIQYLYRVGEVAGAAMRDQFHWRQIQSRLLPVEPEAIAISMLVAALGQQQDWWTEVFFLPDREDHTFAPAIVATRLLRTDA